MKCFHNKIQLQTTPLKVLGWQKSVTVGGELLIVSLYLKILLYEGPIGGSEKCHCKRGDSYCVTATGVTVTGVTVSGELLTVSL